MELLRLEDNKIIITDKVYAELLDGAADGKSPAIIAREWLKTNRNEPWLEVNVPTKPLNPELAAKIGGGEGSIVSYINEQKTLNPSNTYTALTDNSKDIRQITGMLNEPATINVRMVREYTNDLAA